MGHQKLLRILGIHFILCSEITNILIFCK
ncbi:rCG22671, isoform CRA_b [Rattus norvegicus]|uniref:RCG22671, isoform CRA_b n=1 Tax=Rattus norvegicus TaxID=10116 RepID=A6KNK4_RAT|nr:rCG22671, isoform CRA_b [Rattus norvegicus]